MAREKKAKPEAGDRPSRGRVALRWLVRLAVVAGMLAAIGLGGGVYAYEQYVVRDPGPQFEPSHIRSIIAQESPVYYRDGVTRVGVFFADEHRQYVPFDDLPKPYVVAIVAAEDGHYWTHYGVDPKHILRAIYQNLTSGEVVAGGSTLTQQTAKNLFYRPDRSLRSKITELLNALRLEAHYSKSDILEFYANQFHVSGNGRGVGIAARYFFDKDVRDLNLVECAYLAGLVKGPSNYDPFLGDKDHQARARVRAHDRTHYVLQRIVDEPAENLAGPMPIAGDAASEAAYEDRLAAVGAMKVEAKKDLDDGFEINFVRGQFRYDSNAVLDEVARRLQEPPFDEVLKAAGIDDPATSGLEVITTLDESAQREAVYGLWHSLTEVGTELEGLGVDALVHPDSRGPHYDPSRPVIHHEFRVAEVAHPLGDAGKRYLMLDLGGRDCVVDRDAMVRVALAVQRGAKKDRNAKVTAPVVDDLVAALVPGSVVWASVRETDDGAGRAVCDLEVRPELQGAVVVLEDGQVRAMVGGNDNRNFNRASALRQLGSTWKPLVYHAAIELGWSPTDDLDNSRNVFPFSTTMYWPNPDHAPTPVVSMAWAGTNSENLASIWILYHLTDRLDDDEIARLADVLGLARKPDEAAPAYRARIQKLGVLPTPRRVDEGVFLQARHEVDSGMLGSTHPEDRLGVESMLYGWGFDAERERAMRESGALRAAKLKSLDRSWLVLQPKIERCGKEHDALTSAIARGGLPMPEDIPDLTVQIDGDHVHVACGAIPEGYAAPDEQLLPVVSATPTPELDGTTPRIHGIWGRLFGGTSATDEPALPVDPVVDPADDMLVDGVAHLVTLRQIDTSITRRKLARDALGDQAPDLYSPDVLYAQQDFRTLLGMRYVAELARQYGVRTEIREVLAMPLGASEITIEEATSVYAGITTGSAWDFPGTVGGVLGNTVASPAAPTLLIAELRDVDGNVIYRANPTQRAVTTPQTGAMTADILRNVVKSGTGRRALDAIPAAGADGVQFALPVGGKTGTTNDYKNVAFVGYAPVATPEGYAVDGAWFVGVYVGYDDNHPMEVGNIRLAGASGALPAWIDTVRGLQSAGLLGEPPSLRPTDPWWPLVHPSGLAVVPVDAKTGRPVGDALSDTDGGGDVGSANTVLALPGSAVEAPIDVRFEPSTRPIRVAPSTDQAGAITSPTSLWGTEEHVEQDP